MTVFRDLLKEKSDILYSKFRNITEDLESLYLKYTTLPFYTSHGKDHSRSIEIILDNLVTDEIKNQMNEAEIFVLLCSAYFHDIGMAIKLCDDDLQQPNQTKESYDRKLDEIRRTHSERTFKYIKDKEAFKLFSLDKGMAFAIAEICKAHSDNKYNGGHWQSREYTFKELMKRKSVKTIGKYDIRLHFLAALIRVADELDLDFQRSFEDLENIRGIPDISKLEQIKHQLISGIKIDSNNFGIFVDIFEGELYGNTEEENELLKSIGKNDTSTPRISTAEKNSGLTEAVIKLRKALREVVKPLNDNGLMYNRIKFRDPAILALSDELKRKYKINEDTQVIFNDKRYNGALINGLLYDIESLELSPEYIISNKMDFLFFEEEHFSHNIDYIFDEYIYKHIEVKKDEKGDGKLNRQSIKNNLFFRLGQLVNITGSEKSKSPVDFYYTVINQLSKNFKKYADEEDFINEILGKILPENSDICDLIEHKLKKNLRKIIIEKLKKEFLFIIMKEIYNCLRRENYEKKCKNHNINIIFSGDLFSNMHKKLLWNQLPKERKKEFLKTKLKKLKRYSEKEEYDNIRFYYHNRALLSELKVVSSELALIRSVSQESIKVINDVNGVIYYYDKCIDLLEHPDTWKIKSVNFEELKFTFDADDEYYKKNKTYKDFFIKQAQDDIQGFLKNI